jgi:N-acetylmuramoyl-L-alanine amidase
MLYAETMPGPSDHAVVFIDPGHGGQDAGAQGPDGLLEKTVTLALGKRIETHLGTSHRTLLSRTDDYNVELCHRTETANHQKSDLFISLHSGGAFNYNRTGVSIYFFLDSPGRLLPGDPDKNTTLDQTLPRVPWHSVQYRHAAESRILAEFLQATLAPLTGASNCRISGAPLLVLSSADMPAVLIEIGCLNAPGDEAKLANPDHLDSLAKAIAGGITNYLDHPPGITSIDLHE